MSTSRLLSSTAGRIATALAVVAVALGPFVLGDDFWMTVLANTAIFAIAGVGLSLLTGYAGQVSLGHAAMLSIGGYTAVWFGADKGWPLPLWLLVTAIVGSAVGALVGPFALRFSGNYLTVVTLALLFITVHVFENWDGFTNGFDGKSASDLPLSLGPVDFAELSIPGREFTREQGLYYLCWLVLGLVLVLARNVVRTRPGRALQAIRDRDIAAEIIGVHTSSYKIGVFAAASGIAALAGGLWAASVRFITPGDPAGQLFLSIRFVAIIIVGGLGSLWGVVVGALVVGPLNELLEKYADLLSFTIPGLGRPLIKETPTSDGLFPVAALAETLFGVLLVAFLMFAPRGVAGMLGDLRSRLAGRRRSPGDSPDPTA